jgi:hypothetical protein
VERTSKTVQTSGQRQIRRAEGTADKVGGVRADVTTLVVRVDGQVETHQLNKVLVVTESELVSQVEGIILVLLDSGDLAILEDVAVDAGSNGGELGNEVHGVLEGVLPVFLLIQTFGVGLGEGRFVLESSDGKRELSHGVEVVGAAVNELLDELGDVGASSPLSGQVADLLFARDLTSKQQPEETYLCELSSRIDFQSAQLSYLQGEAPSHQGPWGGFPGIRGSMKYQPCPARER